MYNTFREVVETVKEKYQGINKLAKVEVADPITGRMRTKCFYKHEANGIGCAIGCLLPADLAASLDEIGVAAIDSILYAEDGYTTRIREYIAPTVPVEDLERLQAWHDTADTVDDFISKLENWLEANPA